MADLTPQQVAPGLGAGWGLKPGFDPAKVETHDAAGIDPEEFSRATTVPRGHGWHSDSTTERQ